MELWREWWVWVTAGGVLAILELLLPGQILLGFAAGAVLTGLLVGTGFLGSSISSTLLIFALASLAAWALFRYLFRGSSTGPKIIERDINDNPR